MTKEKLHNPTEHAANPEILEKAGAEQRERLRNKLEEAEAKHKEKLDSLEHIQREAIERASSLDQVAKMEKSPVEKRHGLFTKQQRDASFDRQMNAIQEEMRPAEKLFSRFIHKRSVENVSDAIGKTIARPNALLAGSAGAFIIVTCLYLVAKYYGYPLSGFETIGAFILGWVLGLFYDYIRLLILGRKGQ